MHARAILIGSLAAALLAARPVHAAEPVYTGWFTDVAVGGHDVVAYFTRGEPVEGAREHSIEWRGARWRFASAAHLRRFRAAPERYAPAYGGYCAHAVAMGTTEPGDPRYWTIHDGRLFLNYDADTRARWDQDREAHIAAADEHWAEITERGARSLPAHGRNGLVRDHGVNAPHGR